MQRSKSPVMGSYLSLGRCHTLTLLLLRGVVLTAQKKKGKRALVCDIGELEHHHSAEGPVAAPLRRLQVTVREAGLEAGESFEILQRALKRPASVSLPTISSRRRFLRGAVVDCTGAPYISSTGVATVLCRSVEAPPPACFLPTLFPLIPRTVEVRAGAPAEGDKEAHRRNGTNQLQLHRYSLVEAHEPIQRYQNPGANGVPRSRRPLPAH
jgi:hypothetical protein